MQLQQELLSLFKKIFSLKWNSGNERLFKTN